MVTIVEDQSDESTELLDQMDMAIALFKDSLRELRNSKQPNAGPLDEFNGLLDQMDMAVGLFSESVGKMRATSVADGPTDADFTRFNQTEGSRRNRAMRVNRSRRSKEFGEFNDENRRAANESRRPGVG